MYGSAVSTTARTQSTIPITLIPISTNPQAFISSNTTSYTVCNAYHQHTTSHTDTLIIYCNILDMPVCDRLQLRAKHNYTILAKHVSWQILQKMKHERPRRAYDQQQRPGRQPCVDNNQRCPTHFEVQRNSCHQLQSYPTYTTQPGTQ